MTHISVKALGGLGLQSEPEGLLLLGSGGRGVLTWSFRSPLSAGMTLPRSSLVFQLLVCKMKDPVVVFVCAWRGGFSYGILTVYLPNSETLCHEVMSSFIREHRISTGAKHSHELSLDDFTRTAG